MGDTIRNPIWVNLIQVKNLLSFFYQLNLMKAGISGTMIASNLSLSNVENSTINAFSGQNSASFSGGIVGHKNSGSILGNCACVTSTILSVGNETYSGGISGRSEDNLVEHSSSSSNTITSNSPSGDAYASGVIGSNKGTIRYCSSINNNITSFGRID